MAKKVITVRLTGGWTDEQETAAATSIQIIVPSGLMDWQAREYVIGRAASEIARYAAEECLLQIQPRSNAAQ